MVLICMPTFSTYLSRLLLHCSPRQSICNFLNMLQIQSPFVLSFSALFFALFCHCSGTQFIVGDSSGWVIPPYQTYYSNWSHSHFMRAGDSLEFNFDAKFYNLIQVSKYEYEHCTSLEPVKVFNSSPAVFPLNERGVFFFICNISNYCCLGQKIAISVHECSSQNPPSPSPSPSPSPPSSPSQVPISAPLSPNGSAPHQSHGISPMPTPGGNGVHSPPKPSSPQGEKSTAMALVCGRSFTVSLARLLSAFGAFLGFWVM